ncbi:HNH/ENDO VII family nuclease, partial [Pseudomonas syringae]|uniref:HNH/ENDO VII family nuclease n=3 Tax=Pseudomonas TaxID=286 RepID=UPI001C81D972
TRKSAPSVWAMVCMNNALCGKPSWPEPAIAEVTQSFHQQNSGAIHINSGSDIPSGVNRSQFEKWKKRLLEKSSK